jgi:hypothetical protein
LKFYKIWDSYLTLLTYIFFIINIPPLYVDFFDLGGSPKKIVHVALILLNQDLLTARLMNVLLNKHNETYEYNTM